VADTPASDPLDQRHGRPRAAGVIGIVGYEGDETAYPYRCDGNLDTGLEVPTELLERLVAAEREHDAATAAIRRYIADRDVPEIDLTDLDETTIR
jgi:hypothetical protein